jgi:arginyl-tRNA synthetase
MEEPKKVTVNVRIDSYKGRIISVAQLDGSKKEETKQLNTGVIGKHAVYFEFVSDRPDEDYSFDKFTFD